MNGNGPCTTSNIRLCVGARYMCFRLDPAMLAGSGLVAFTHTCFPLSLACCALPPASRNFHGRSAAPSTVREISTTEGRERAAESEGPSHSFPAKSVQGRERESGERGDREGEGEGANRSYHTTLTHRRRRLHKIDKTTNTVRSKRKEVCCFA